MYRVENLPTDGKLLKSGIEMKTGSLFTQQDVKDSKISYQHTGAELSDDGTDSVQCSVRDGAGGEITPVVLTINITDVNAQINISGASQDVPEFVDGAAEFTVLNLNLNDADGEAYDNVSFSIPTKAVTTTTTW